MAVLTNEDFTRIKHMLRSDPAAVSQMTAAALSKQAWKDTLQALEDWWQATGQQTAIKTAMDAAAGVTLTNQLAKKLGKVWMQNKFRGL